MARRTQRSAQAPLVAEYQSWDERSGWQAPPTAEERARRRARSVVHVPAVREGGNTSRVVLTLLVALAALVAAI